MAALALWAIAGTAVARGVVQEPATASTPASQDSETAIAAGPGWKLSLVLRGEVPAAAGLSARVGGVEAPVEGLQRISSYPGGVVLYFDYGLSRSGPIQRLAGDLVESVDALLELGTVEVVVADPDPRTILPPSDRAAIVRQTLERLFVGTVTDDSLRGRRRRFLDELQRDRERASELALEAAADEVAMMRRQQDTLLLWANERGTPGEPSLLILIQEGIGADPLAFYPLHAEGASLERIVSGAPPVEELAAALAARGLVAAPVVLGTDTDSRVRYSPSPDLPVGFRIGLGGRDRDSGRDPAEEIEEVDADLHTPSLSAARELAAGTGGEVLDDLENLGEWLTELQPRSLLTILLAAPAPAAVERLEIRTRAGEPAAPRAQRWAPHPYTPPAVGGARARFALADELDPTELEVTAALRLSPTAAQPNRAEVDAVVDLSTDDQAAASGPWRFTVGVHTLDEETLVLHDTQTPLPQNAERTDGTVAQTAALALPSGADAVLVVAEDLGSGTWGFGLAEIDAPAAVAGGDDERVAIQAGPPLRLIPPRPGQASGTVTVGTETLPSVDRVDFYLDGRRIERARQPPFEARVSIGESERLAQLVAVAFDRDGKELARDRMVLNEPPTSFWVRLTDPQPDARPTDVEEVAAQLRLPAGGRLSRVDFYWRDRLLGSATEEPYRAKVTLPVRDPGGFVRVEAVLSDGRRAEDVMVLRTGFGEEIGVELVELYLVALDRTGAPVRGLAQQDFKILEEGKEQTVESFQLAGDLPLTVGLAIDSSRSLFRRMPAVQRAAVEFVDSLVQGRDRALLVGFGSEPRLVTPPTNNFDRVRDGIRSLEPKGTTAVWAALHSSLEQIESLAGRRALVAFYDGDDEDQESSFERALSLARRSRVPVYLILMNDEAARTEGRSLESRAFVNRLERISRAGGGRVYYVATEQELGTIFAAISDELRSHYLLTYYPVEEPGGPLWRPVTVEVLRRGVTARTIEGRGFTP